MKVRHQLQSCKKEKKKLEATKIAVNQEEQSVDHTLRGNKRGADYLQSLLSGKLMLNQFHKMHLFRQAEASRGNLWSLLKMCFFWDSSCQLSVFVSRFVTGAFPSRQTRLKVQSKKTDEQLISQILTLWNTH